VPVPTSGGILLDVDDGSPITRLLERVQTGDRSAADELLPLVYSQLRAMACRQMATERNGHTLNATALVHEACIKLLGRANLDLPSRGAFFASVGEAMRQILVDHARSRATVKRGGNRARLPLSIADLAVPENFELTLILDDAFLRLQEYHPEMAEVVRLRFFAGLTVQQTAEALGVSEATVKRRWTWARAWLFRAISGSGVLEEDSSDGADRGV
jgi:RNA polymerase sigma factor (TIGR02999 family)